MTPRKLPEDLSTLAQQLGNCENLPSPQLKTRVMQTVEQELGKGKVGNIWHYAAACAAVLVILANLFHMAARCAPQKQEICQETVQAYEQQIRDCDLGLSEEEIKRQSIIMTAGENLIPLAMPTCNSAGSEE